MTLSEMELISDDFDDLSDLEIVIILLLKGSPMSWVRIKYLTIMLYNMIPGITRVPDHDDIAEALHRLVEMGIVSFKR